MSSYGWSFRCCSTHPSKMLPLLLYYSLKTRLSFCSKWISSLYQELNLSFGEITEEAALAVAHAVKDKEQLQRLDLNGTSLHSRCTDFPLIFGFRKCVDVLWSSKILFTLKETVWERTAVKPWKRSWKAWIWDNFSARWGNVDFVWVLSCN